MRNWAILHRVLGIFRKGHRPWSLLTKLFIVVVFIASLADVGLTLLAALIGSPELHNVGVNRDTCTGMFLLFPRNMLYYPYSSSFTCWRGNFRGQISWDICVILFLDQSVDLTTMMKYISVAMIQVFVVLLTLMVYYFVEIIAMGRAGLG